MRMLQVFFWKEKRLPEGRRVLELTYPAAELGLRPPLLYDAFLTVNAQGGFFIRRKTTIRRHCPGTVLSPVIQRLTGRAGCRSPSPRARYWGRSSEVLFGPAP